MADPLRVANLRFTPSPDDTTGRLGWVDFDCGPFRIRSAQLRRSASGRVYLSLRSSRRALRFGREVARVELVGDEARRELERAEKAELCPCRREALAAVRRQASTVAVEAAMLAELAEAVGS